MRTQIFNALKITTLAVFLSFGLSYVYAWTAPIVTPPGGNVSAPINTSGTAQTKAGNFTISATTTSSYFADLLNPAFFVQPSGTSKLWDVMVAGTTTTNGLKVLNGAGAEKVLTSDASGNGSWVLAPKKKILAIEGYSSAISGHSSFSVTSVLSNTLFALDPSTSNITIPVSGPYQITSSAYLCISGANTYIVSGIDVNGVTKAQHVNYARECASTEDIVPLLLNAGDVVQSWCGDGQGLSKWCTMSVVQL